MSILLCGVPSNPESIEAIPVEEEAAEAVDGSGGRGGVEAVGATRLRLRPSNKLT